MSDGKLERLESWAFTLSGDVPHWRYTELLKVAKRLRDALQARADDVEKIARDSFATPAGTFEADFRSEDPEGFAVWQGAVKALSALETDLHDAPGANE